MKLKTTEKVTVYLYEDLIRGAEKWCKKFDMELVEFITEALDEHIQRYKEEDIY